jgi:integrase
MIVFSLTFNPKFNIIEPNKYGFVGGARQMSNRNHPKKGSRIRVEPIRSLEAVESIKALLGDSPRDYLLFVLGVNNGLRAGDLIRLRAGQFRGAETGDTVPIVEQKTGKPQEVVVNEAVKEALDRYFAAFQPADEDFLFRSRKGKNRPVSVQTVNGLVKKWCREAGLKGNYGSHTLRKTFGYILRRKFGIGWDILAHRLNHSSPAVTRAYLGIQDDEVNGVLMRCVI